MAEGPLGPRRKHLAPRKESPLLFFLLFAVPLLPYIYFFLSFVLALLATLVFLFVFSSLSFSFFFLLFLLICYYIFFSSFLFDPWRCVVFSFVLMAGPLARVLGYVCCNEMIE